MLKEKNASHLCNLFALKGLMTKKSVSFDLLVTHFSRNVASSDIRRYLYVLSLHMLVIAVFYSLKCTFNEGYKADGESERS